jgi:hypothetical protein
VRAFAAYNRQVSLRLVSTRPTFADTPDFCLNLGLRYPAGIEQTDDVFESTFDVFEWRLLGGQGSSLQKNMAIGLPTRSLALLIGVEVGRVRRIEEPIPPAIHLDPETDRCH